MKDRMNEAVVYHGDEIKALGDGRVGGYLVRFTTENDPDLHGEFFTKSTYFGPRDGDGADMLFHHGIPVKAGLEHLADHIFKPIKTRRDEIGIWAEAVLDAANKYEAAVLELAMAGKLGWSSGTAKYLVKATEAGEITRWPIIEGSLTPTPAEPRNKARAIKSLDELVEEPASEIRAAIEAAKDERTFEKALRDAGFSRKTAELTLSRAKAIFQGDPDELAEAKAELANLMAEAVRLKAENYLLRFPLPTLKD